MVEIIDDEETVKTTKPQTDTTPKTHISPLKLNRDFKNRNKLIELFKGKDHYILKDLIVYCLDQQISRNNIQDLIKAVTDKDCWDYYVTIIKEIYNYERDYLGLLGLKDEFSTTEITIIEENIHKPKNLDVLYEKISSDVEIRVDRIKHQVFRVRLKTINDKNFDKEDLIIDAAPTEVIIFDDPLTEKPRGFHVEWETGLSNRPFVTTGERGEANINEIATYIENAGYSPHPKHLKGVIPTVINAYQKEGLAILKEEVENPGFFYDKVKDKIINVKYKCPEPTLNELFDGVNVLTDLGESYKTKTEKTKLASMLKWGWMAAFSYIKKQKGTWMPWAYVYGQAGSGKTTLGKIVLYLWECPNENNETGGSSFNSEYKVGNILSRGTLPVLVNEPLGLFQSTNVFEMLKTSIEHTIARSKNINGVFTQIQGFAPIMMTANRQAPLDDAFLRRTYRISFKYNERKTKKEQQEFEKKFKVSNPKKSPLKKLQAISRYFAEQIILDPNLLDEDWQQVADLILNKLEIKLHKENPNFKLPSWIFEWQEMETLEESDAEQRELLRMFFMDKLNQQSRKITIDGYAEPQQPLDASDDYIERGKQVIKSKLIPWMYIKEIKKAKKSRQEYVCVTTGIMRDIPEMIPVDGLTSLSQLLGWYHGTVRSDKEDEPSRKVSHVELDKFLKWVYMDDIGDEFEEKGDDDKAL